MNEQLSLCVSEFVDDSNVTQWRRVADYVPASKTFYQVAKAQQPQILDTDIIPCPSAVNVLSWGYVNGKVTAGIASSQPVIYETYAPKEFQDVFIEDVAQVKRILKNGFSLPAPVKNSFHHGDTKVVICVPSKEGDYRGFLMNDALNWEFRESGRIFFMASVFPKPEDSARAPHAIPVLDYEGIGSISYCYERGSTRPERFFLASQPTRISSFCPYETAEYALIFTRRYLDQAKASIALHQDRALTNRDITHIMEATSKAAESIETIQNVMGISDPKVLKDVSKGLQEIMPSIAEQVKQEDTLAVTIRETLWDNEEIKKFCVNGAKEKFSKEVQAACEGERKCLEAIKKEIAEQSSVKDEYAKLQKQLTSANEELESKTVILAGMKEKMAEEFRKYNTDFMALASASLGTTMRNMPLYTEGEEVRDTVSVLRSLKKGFAHAANTIWKENWHVSGHVAVPGECACLAADILSVKRSNMTAAVVTRADADVSAKDMLDAIERANTTVVLVEGVYGCVSDAFTLALIRKAKKQLVFSIDDDSTINTVSGVIKKTTKYLGAESK